LELSESEKAKFTEQLGAVLEYFEKLDAADTSGVSEIGQINKMENVSAEDKIGEKYDREELLSNAPAKEDDFIKVKAVFE
jgi:aspartyl-tRNA(Asn)/glutamyl-tRNA(Gln) amidotransferase subunit C